MVLGDDAVAIEDAIDLAAERRIRNPDPSRGLSSSVRLGVAAVDAEADAALLVLGDQPRLGVDVIAALLAGGVDAARPVAAPAYGGDDGGRNPVLLGRAAFGLVESLTGDRGLGPLLASHPELVRAVPVSGTQPRCRHARGPRRAPRGALGRAGPGQHGPGRPAPRDPRRERFLRPGDRPLPGRPDPDRRAGTGPVAGAGDARRDVARHRGGRRPLRPADRPVAGAVGRLGHRRRPVGRDARRVARAGERIRDRQRRDRPRPDGRRRPATSLGSRRTSRSSPTSATTSRRSVPSWPRWSRVRAGCASRCSWSGSHRRSPMSAGRRSMARNASRCRPCRRSSSSFARSGGPRRSSGSTATRAGSRPATSSRGSCAASSGSSPGHRRTRRFQAALDPLLVIDDDGRVGLVGQQPLPIGIVTWKPDETSR